MAKLKTRHDELEATLQQLKITQRKSKVILKAMPLGSFLDFKYQQKTLKLRPGDTVLFVVEVSAQYRYFSGKSEAQTQY